MSKESEGWHLEERPVKVIEEGGTFILCSVKTDYNGDIEEDGSFILCSVKADCNGDIEDGGSFLLYDVIIFVLKLCQK